MNHPKDRTLKLLEKSHRLLSDYYRLALGGDWPEAEEIEAHLKQLQRAILYREPR